MARKADTTQAQASGARAASGIPAGWGARSLAALTLGLAVSASAAPPLPARVSVERLQFVDCMLPGQLRRLGGRMSYQGPRRPVRTTIADCEIRGGEYVAYDRADYATSLQLWLPQAEAGDTGAQVYVGEIYEKGTGKGPDYALAAQWYAKAAAAGSAAARNHLAYLYEQGLGVQQDALRAVNLYREAAGLTNDQLVLASELESRTAALTAQLTERTQGLAKAAEQLDRTRTQLAAQREALTKAERAASTLRTRLAAQRKAGGQEAARLRTELAGRDQRIEEQHRALTALEQSSAQQSAQLTRQLTETQRAGTLLKAEIGDPHVRSLTTRAQLAALQAQVAALDQEAAQLREEARRRQSTLQETGRPRRRRAPPQITAADLERAQAVARSLDEERQSLAAQVRPLTQQLAMARSQASQAMPDDTTLRAQLATLESERLGASRELVDLSARVQSDIRAVSETRARLTVAPAGDTERLNAELQAGEVRLRRERAQARGLEVAVQTGQSQIAELRMHLATKGAPLLQDEPREPALPAAVNVDARALGLGGSFALLIDNARYRDAGYRPLPSVQKDALAVEGALARYGFKDHTTRLDNGSRDDIMNAIAAFSAQLGPADSALIYYSGHGTITEAGNVTYWIPSDADPANPASWVSTGWVTEMIGQMRARHILVVVDSCYAGALVHSTNLRLSSRSAAVEPDRVRLLARLPSRTVLTSGGNEPVAATGPGGSSLFAGIFTQILERNTRVLDASTLYDLLSDRMGEAGGASATPQLPRYSVLANTNHLNGDFLFVPGRGS